MTEDEAAGVARTTMHVFGPLFDWSPHPMVVFDAELRHVAVNAAYEDFVQRPRRELLHRLPDPAHFRFPDGGGPIEQLVAGTSDGCQTEVEVQRPDGTTAWATVVGHVVRDDGELINIGLQLIDITSIRRSQSDLAVRVEVSAAIREASANLAASTDGELHPIVAALSTQVAVATELDSIVVAWRSHDGTGALVIAGPDDDQPSTIRLEGAELAEVLELADGESVDPRAIPGMAPGPVLTLRPFGDPTRRSGWIGLPLDANRDGDGATLDPLSDFLDQAVQRVTRAAGERRRMRLQAFVNATASDYLAHRFTGDRQEVLDGTLAGLAEILDAVNAQFRIVDWDRMVSEITAEYVAEGHSETDDDFRVLDLNIPLYRDIVVNTDPSTFEIAERSILNVPLVVEGDTTATLNVAGPAGRDWAEMDIDACRSLAGLMVQLQRRTGLERTLAQRLELGELVNYVAIEFNEATAEAADNAIADALGATAQALDAPRIALWRHDHAAARASLDAMWENGVGGTSLAGFVEIDVSVHPDAAELFDSTSPRVLGPTDVPRSFGDIPEDLHLLYVPVARSGEARLALSVESWGVRSWGDAEIEAVQSVARLIAQLSARVEAELAMGKRLAVEDLTRKIATDMLHLSNATSLEGIADALGMVGEALALDVAALWLIDRRNGDVRLTTRWAGPDTVTIDADSVITFEEPLTTLAQQSGTVIEIRSARHPIVSGVDDSVALVAPLSRAEEGTTAFLVFERADGGEWTSEDRRAIDMVGALIIQLGARLEAENYFETAFDNAPVGISLRDGDGRLLACNRAFEEFAGRSQDELLGTTVIETLRPDYVDSDAPEREFRLRRPDGTNVWGRVTEANIRSASEMGGDLWLRHITDITETRQAVEQLEYQAGHDELTGLANRRVLMEQLRTCLQPVPHATDAAVLLLDIDRFKVVNDSLGHSTGDEVLRVLADRLRLAVRPQDLVCRLGGDEFVVLLRGPVSGVESSAVAARLLDLMADPIEVGSLRMSMSASIGIANPTADDVALEDVLRHADSAMYKAKSKGRNRFEVFDQRHRDALAYRLEVESDLRRAIEEESLELHFQPEVELESGELLGAEALVRWPHPRLGLLSAGSFIDVAEETGQIVGLGQLVLSMACRQAGEWNRGRRQPLTFRVNLSAHQLDRPELVEEVRSALETYDVHPEHLCLEITETAIMADVDESLTLLERLRGVGVRLAIDDFGTGFSSLAYLKRLPVDILKIDQAFVRGLGRDRDDEAIVQSVLSMAAALDLEVVAEGIETTAQRLMLLEMGCTRGQGFGLHRPAPAAELDWLIEAGSIDVQQMSSAD